MNKPNNYDNTTTGGNYTPIELGGHIIVIKQVEEMKSKTGKNMLRVYFDFDKSDAQAGKFAQEFKDDVRPDKKWSNAGTKYVLTEGQDGNCTKDFKSFITSFEKSNNCEALWGDKFCPQFKNKRIGGVFGEVENEYNGKRTMRHELRWWCEADKAKDAAIPAPKYLKDGGNGSGGGQTPADWMAVDESADDEIPFK